MYSIYRVMEEIEEVVGDKPDVEADDLEKLTYMTQVLCNSLCMVPSVLLDFIMCSAQISLNGMLQCINALSLAVPVF